MVAIDFGLYIRIISNLFFKKKEVNGYTVMFSV